MIAGSGICLSFKRELLEGMHDFSTGTYMIALYSANASLSVDTEGYITEGEISGPGYTAGGIALQNVQILGPEARTVYVTFDNPVWTNSTLEARGALIYAQNGLRAVAVLDFVTDQSSNTGEFRVMFPPPGPSTALIRIL